MPREFCEDSEDDALQVDLSPLCTLDGQHDLQDHVRSQNTSTHDRSTDSTDAQLREAHRDLFAATQDSTLITPSAAAPSRKTKRIKGVEGKSRPKKKTKRSTQIRSSPSIDRPGATDDTIRLGSTEQEGLLQRALETTSRTRKTPSKGKSKGELEVRLPKSTQKTTIVDAVAVLDQTRDRQTRKSNGRSTQEKSTPAGPHSTLLSVSNGLSPLGSDDQAADVKTAAIDKPETQSSSLDTVVDEKPVIDKGTAIDEETVLDKKPAVDKKHAIREEMVIDKKPVIDKEMVIEKASAPSIAKIKTTDTARAIYRVGLSKRQSIPSLLKMRKK